MGGIEALSPPTTGKPPLIERVMLSGPEFAHLESMELVAAGASPVECRTHFICR